LFPRMQDGVVPSVPWRGDATHNPWVAAQDAIVMSKSDVQTTTACVFLFFFLLHA
jgi:hypothetical protein